MHSNPSHFTLPHIEQTDCLLNGKQEVSGSNPNVSST